MADYDPNLTGKCALYIDLYQDFKKILESISAMHLTPDGKVLNLEKVLTTTNELKLKMI
jgi:hypothetical protein